MDTIKVNASDGLATVTLDRGRSNPINLQMISDLDNQFRQFETDDQVGGVILTGKDGFFSSGIDLMEVYDYNEDQSKQFWSGFLALQGQLASFKKPLVTAISGHSPAGGCVIAICSDYRVMAEGNFIIGLNEIPVGIIVPDFIFSLYAFWIGQRKAYQYLLEGKLFKAEEAFRIGLIDEVCPKEKVMDAAEKKIRTYMQFNPVTWSHSKLNLRKELITKLSADQTPTLNLMLKQWWAPETRLGLQIIIQNLRSKNTPDAK